MMMMGSGGLHGVSVCARQANAPNDKEQKTMCKRVMIEKQPPHRLGACGQAALYCIPSPRSLPPPFHLPLSNPPPPPPLHRTRR